MTVKRREEKVEKSEGGPRGETVDTDEKKRYRPWKGRSGTKGEGTT